ncbi:MAG: hypothetical protein JO103_07925, partial [Candidatus Eremiobacteraeota bacterium]|nr:hypothetical protein [Candidatus Eremiobacteraeota bacterium]
LNFFAPVPYCDTFVVEGCSTQCGASELLVQLLAHPDAVPPAVLWDCSHWIVISGVQTDVDPRTGQDYTINGYYYDSPVLVPKSAQTPPPHANDDCCGTKPIYGTPNEYITYTDWKNGFDGCVDDGTRYYYVVCEELRASTGRLKSQPPAHVVRNSDMLIGSADAQTDALDGIREHGLDKSGPLAGALAGVTTGDPILVRRLDVLDTYYYLVPLLRDAVIHGYARVDAMHGNFLGVSAGDHVFDPIPTADQIALLIRDAKGGSGDGAYRLRPGTYAVNPTPVWQRCYEAFSPYQPLYQVAAGNRTLYAAADGTLYPSLTLPQRGE